MRVLFLTHRLPYAPNRGDRLRAFHIVRSLAARADLELVSLVHDRDELAQVPRVEAMGARVTAVPVPRLRNLARGAAHLLGRQPLTHVLLDAPGLSGVIRSIVRQRPPDVVLAYCSGMARFALEPPLSDFPLVVDLVDVDSQKWLALSESSSWPKRWIYEREAQHLADFERRLSAAASAVFVVNDRERKLMRMVVPGSNVAVVPVGLDVETHAPRTPPAPRARVVFCGVMNYTPNVDGVRWFARDVWPLVRAKRPDAQFVIVGSDPASIVRRLRAADNGIEVTGTVDDVRPYLWESALSIAPLFMARGVQTKVLEAVAAGLPAVVTSAVFEGLPTAIRSACRVADTAEAYAAATLAILDLPPSERRRIAQTADLTQLGWDAQLQPLHDALASATPRKHAVAV
ncbi:MAG TPA: TIGR03087 family PEP-CTERM/XrtA system glycosyltransferase [Vicinamibacterales bacterium]|nr:TIGR03087 family PEP-CTERM/XrtA system glycosyltransferase [Vicinamibacterales bacterium]